MQAFGWALGEWVGGRAGGWAVGRAGSRALWQRRVSVYLFDCQRSFCNFAERS